MGGQLAIEGHLPRGPCLYIYFGDERCGLTCPDGPLSAVSPGLLWKRLAEGAPAVGAHEPQGGVGNSPVPTVPGSAGGSCAHLGGKSTSGRTAGLPPPPQELLNT